MKQAGDLLMSSEQKLRNSPALGRNIRALRKEQNLTQEQLAARLQLYGTNISRSILSQMECGTYNVKVSELAAMAKILKVDYNAFFKGVDAVPPE